MPKFERCPQSVADMARDLMFEFATHKPLIDARVKVDLVFAYGDRDDKDKILNDALRKNGCKALGVARKLPLKDRAMGRGDAEIAIDGDWWNDAAVDEQRALLDHELHHFSIKLDKSKRPMFDDLGRPLIALRPHDFEFGWFKVIAERHGIASQERLQAKQMMDNGGQFFWPGIFDHAHKD